MSVWPRVALAGLPIEETDLRDAAPIDRQKFYFDVDVLHHRETAKHGVQNESKELHGRPGNCTATNRAFGRY